ncbi:LysR family transcriptional regulator [Pseudomonas sp. PhalM4]
MNLLDGITVFIQIVDTGSFAEAARQLSLSPSTVSKLIARTEETLGSRLFNRNTRSISLTLEGRMFLERGRLILQELEAAKQDIASASGSTRGSLKISMPNLPGVFYPAISGFKDMFPEIDLELDFSDRIVDIIEEGFDVVVRAGHLSDSRLAARLIGNFRMNLVAAPSYLKSCPDLKCPEDLKNHQCIQYRYPSTGRLEPWPNIEALGRDITAGSQIVSNNTDFRLSMALSGKGIAFLPNLLSNLYLERGELEIVLGESIQQTYGLYLVWPTNKQATARVRKFINYFNHHLPLTLNLFH